MYFNNMNVLVLGDICLDVITKGESTRLSPEAPVPIIKNPKSDYFLGMAGNVALNLANLGTNVYIESIMASDFAGYKIKELFEKNNINTLFYSSELSFSTIVKERIFANNHQVARIDYEIETPDFSELMAKHLDEMFNINQFDFIIISDYNKGVITQKSMKLLKPVLDKINKSGIYFVDTKKLDVLNYFEGMILTPNSLELSKIIKHNNCDSVNELLFELDTDFIIETASENGAFAYTKNNIIHEPTHSLDVVDVCGCGDTFIAAFSLYYMKFKSIGRALDFANYCCSKVIRRKGTSSVVLSEVIDYDNQN